MWILNCNSDTCNDDTVFIKQEHELQLSHCLIQGI